MAFKSSEILEEFASVASIRHLNDELVEMGLRFSASEEGLELKRARNEAWRKAHLDYYAAYQREYHKNPENRAKRNARAKERCHRPEVKEANRLRQARLRLDPAYRAKQQEWQRKWREKQRLLKAESMGLP